MEAQWRIYLLGGLHAEGCGQVLTRFRTQKAGVLLAYLAYYPQRAHRRDQLIELFWPECDLPAGRNNLSRELAWLRQQLEPPGISPGAVIAADRAAVRLNPDAAVTDVAAFEAALQTAERAVSPAERTVSLVQAIEGYGGELLPGYYDGWILQEREWLAERYFQALAHLLVHLEHAREFPRALEYARCGIRADPLREEAHRALMRLLAAVGQPDAALRQYRQLERLLKQELEAEPSAATQALAQQLAVLADEVGASEFFTSPHEEGGWQYPHGPALRTAAPSARGHSHLSRHRYRRQHLALGSAPRGDAGGSGPLRVPPPRPPHGPRRSCARRRLPGAGQQS